MSEHSEDVAAVIDRLRLQPHPEGAWYAETWRHDSPRIPDPPGRPSTTCSPPASDHWHRVDATEIWHFYAGDPLRLAVQAGDAPVTAVTLGPDLVAGEVPQAIVPAGAWQSAGTSGAWSLMGCTVSPGFTFDGFELAPPDWTPPGEPSPGGHRRRPSLGRRRPCIAVRRAWGVAAQHPAAHRFSWITVAQTVAHQQLPHTETGCSYRRTHLTASGTSSGGRRPGRSCVPLPRRRG